MADLMDGEWGSTFGTSRNSCCSEFAEKCELSTLGGAK